MPSASGPLSVASGPGPATVGRQVRAAGHQGRQLVFLLRLFLRPPSWLRGEFRWRGRMKQVLDPATHDRHVRGKKHAVARRASTVRTGFGPKKSVQASGSLSKLEPGTAHVKTSKSDCGPTD